MFSAPTSAPRSSKKSVQGLYAKVKAAPILEKLKKKYLLRSKGPENRMVRILPELSSLARFRRLNFMDDDFGFREPFDIIFCRNGISYFDRPTQERLLSRLVENLESGRYIFLGHSETLLGLTRPLKQRAPSGLQEDLIFPAPLYPMRSGCISC